jgi:hypothetical protein
MLTVQRSIRYEGDVHAAPFRGIRLEIDVPEFRYEPAGGASFVARFVQGHRTVAVVRDVRDKSYRAEISVDALVGTAPQSVYDFYRYHRVEPRAADELDPHTIPLEARIVPMGAAMGSTGARAGAGTGFAADAMAGAVGRVSWRAIYGERQRDTRGLRTRSLDKAAFEQRFGTRQQIAANTVPSLRLAVERDGFFVNKAAYDALRARINAMTSVGADNPIYLLVVIEALVDLDTGTPRLRPDAAAVRNDLEPIFLETEVKDVGPVLDLVEKNFESLFDFPVAVPEVPVVAIAGTLSSSTPSPLTPEDLRFYDLSVEYADSAGSTSILRYEWPSPAPALTDGRAAFDLTGKRPLLRQAVPGALTVLVKGFDGSTRWRREFVPSDPELAALDVRVAKYLPAALSGDHAPSAATGKRLRGKVVSLSESRNVEGLTVLVQARNGAPEAPWKIVGSAETDQSGNFSLPYPYGRHTRAQALVSASPDTPAELDIVAERDGETISDDFIYLLLRAEAPAPPPDARTKQGCECDAGEAPTAKRLPEQADLIASDAYTQDIGGTCLNLSTPNRALREYYYTALVRTSDPDVASYTLQRTKDAAGHVAYEFGGGRAKLARGVVDLDNPVRWHDAPEANAELSFYQAVTVATGHVLHFKSVFKADGYSLGELLYSLPLAPGQKKQIVVFDAQHTLAGAESQVLSQGERLSAELVSDRLITDQLSGAIDESLSGRSEASTAGISAGLGVSGSAGAIGGSLGVAGGYSNSNSLASQSSSRGISQFFGEKLRQSVLQNAESYRRLNASVVTTVKEGQEYAVTSEVVANHNHCHSLTMMYFEVLRHYAIFQELSHVEESVFVPLLLTRFSVDNIHKYKDVLASQLLPLPASTYLQTGKGLLFGRQHPLLKGFDAIERIKTNYTRVDYPAAGETYADGQITFLQGDLDVRANLPRPKTNYDRIQSLPLIKTTVRTDEVDVGATVRDEVARAALAAATGGLSLLFDGGPAVEFREKEVIVRQALFDHYMQLDANFQTVPPSQCIRVKSFTPAAVPTPLGPINVTGREFFPDGSPDKTQWEAYATLMGYANVYDFLNNYFAGRLISEWDGIFYDDIMPSVFEKIVESLRLTGLSLDFTAPSQYRGRERRLRLRLRGTSTRTRRQLAELGLLRLESSSPAARALRSFSLLIAERLTLRYSTAHFEGTLFDASLGDDLLDGVLLPVPLSAREKQNPRKEDELIANQLVEHLNSNLEHYNKALWRRLDPDRRFMLLDGFNIEVFDAHGGSLGFRSLASVVKNDLLTIVGNSLVFPVASGYKVNRGFIAVGADGEAREDSLFEHYKPLTPVPPYRLSVPTKGVFMEAVRGSCDACEMVKENSSQDWDRFKTDEPTSIQPVVTPTPVVTEYRPHIKDFAPPLVNVQAAPAAPAPGIGLAQLTELLGKAGVFNDVTGLQGNQRNVLETYLSNQANAKAFAEMSKSLVSQQHNTANSSGFQRQVEEARQQGALDDDDYRDLTRQHLQQQIDGGESDRERARYERERALPSLAEAAVEASRRGQPVSAERTDAHGTRETLRTGTPSEPTTVDIRHAVQPIRQPASRACWAAAATMLVNWRDGTQRTLESILEQAGTARTVAAPAHYLDIFRANTGLPAGEKQEFVTALGMQMEPPANFPLERYVDWLRNYGPLWITTDDDPELGFSPHARILTSIVGDTSDPIFHFIDPADGSTAQSPFSDFVRQFEDLARDRETHAPLFSQIVRFRSRIEATEGQEAGAPVFPSDIILIKSALVRIALEEYQFWHTGGAHAGGAHWEDESPVRERLVSYWTSTFQPTEVPGQVRPGALTEARAGEMIASSAAWSAAFICYCICIAGIQENTVFPRSFRHLTYIWHAIDMKRRGVRSNPVWGYSVGEYSPGVGDLVCRARTDSGIRYDSVPLSGDSHVDIVCERYSGLGRDDNYIIVIGGNLEYDQAFAVRTDRTWENRFPGSTVHVYSSGRYRDNPYRAGDDVAVTAGEAIDYAMVPDISRNVCVGKRKIYLRSDGMLDPTRQWEVLDNTGRVQFVGPQSEYFAILRLRPNEAVV